MTSYLRPVLTPAELEAAIAKYEAIQRWREESGSKEKYDSIQDEYLAWLPEERRKEFRYTDEDGMEWVIASTRSPDHLTCAMHADGWYPPSTPLR